MTPTPEPGVIIGMREIYDAVIELKGEVTGVPGRVTHLEKRVEALTARVYLMAGGAGVTGTIVGALVSKGLKG